jgi:uncharacterized membrane protein
MNAAQIHLALNHFPVATMFLSIPILIWGLLSKKDLIKTVGIAIIIIGTLAGIVVAQSGDGAEKIVEHKAGVTKELIHNHEDAADTAMVAIYLCGALGVAWLVLSKIKNKHTEKIFLLLIISNLVAAGLVGNTAHKGGQIRHDELRDGASNS